MWHITYIFVHASLSSRNFIHELWDVPLQNHGMNKYLIALILLNKNMSENKHLASRHLLKLVEIYGLQVSPFGAAITCGRLLIFDGYWIMQKLRFNWMVFDRLWKNEIFHLLNFRGYTLLLKQLTEPACQAHTHTQIIPASASSSETQFKNQ